MACNSCATASVATCPVESSKEKGREREMEIERERKGERENERLRRALTRLMQLSSIAAFQLRPELVRRVGAGGRREREEGKKRERDREWGRRRENKK